MLAVDCLIYFSGKISYKYTIFFIDFYADEHFKTH